MSLRRKMRAIVALLAAYAVALQATFLAIGGPIAGPTVPGASLGSILGSILGPTLGANSLCLSLRPSTPHPAPIGHERDCSLVCGTCCCSAPAAAPAATAYEKVPAGSIAIAAVIVPTWRFNAGPAHRSRAPPLG